MADNLKDRTVSGMIWTAVQRFGRVIILFIGNLVLARLLSPEDFGYVGMLMVFIAIANTFVDSGFGAALIQRKEPTQLDYSTIFYWNLFVAILLFLLFYILAPLIADFYKLPSLAKILRVQSIVLILNAFSIIQLNQLTKNLEFKIIAKSQILASTIGVLCGIITAIMGFGVWSLVILNLSNALFLNIIVWFTTKWRPLLNFSIKSFKSLFNYGSLILLSSLIETIYTNIQLLIVGKIFSAKVLGYFTQAQKVEQVPVSGLSDVVNQVSFSVYSQIQDNKQRLVTGLRKSMQAVTFLSFPIMVLLVVIAPDLFRLLFTEKWDNSIPLFQMLCIANIITTINTINVSAIKATGKSDINLYANIIKKSIALTLIIVGVYFWEMRGLLFALIIDSFTHFFINAAFVGKLLNYGICKQLKDIWRHYVLALTLGICFYIIYDFINVQYIVKILIICLGYAALYLTLAYCFKLPALFIYYEIIINRFKLKK